MGKAICHIRVCIILFFVIIICFIATIVVNKMEYEKDPSDQKNSVNEYGKQGLPKGTKLKVYPEKIDDNYIYFSDRIVRKFHYNQKDNLFTVQAIRNFMDAIGNSIAKYVILVPSRVTYEEVGLKYSDNCLDSIDEIYGKLSSDINRIDANSILKNHRHEYIYLRTDEDITSLAAYYLAKEFCQFKDIQVEDIGKYKEYRVEHFAGDYTFLEGADIDKKAMDYIAYYIKDDGINWQSVTVRRGEGVYESFESPAVALSRRGGNIFIGGNFSHSILKGDGKNGKTLLIVGGGSAKKIAVWLTPYYQNVYLVSTKWYQGGAKNFFEIFEDYGVTDLIFVGDVDDIGETRYYKKLMDITP